MKFLQTECQNTIENIIPPKNDTIFNSKLYFFVKKTKTFLSFFYLKLRDERTRPILSRAFQKNILNTMSQTGNILVASTHIRIKFKSVKFKLRKILNF